MNFTEDYKKIVDLAYVLLKKHSIRSIDVNELISEAYILTNGEGSQKEIFNAMNGFLFAEKKRLGAFTSEHFKDNNTYQICIKCKESIPAYQFRVKREDGVPDVNSTTCNDCEKKYSVNYAKSENGKIVISKLNKGYVKNISNSYLKKLISNRSASLSEDSISKYKSDLIEKRKRINDKKMEKLLVEGNAIVPNEKKVIDDIYSKIDMKSINDSINKFSARGHLKKDIYIAGWVASQYFSKNNSIY